MFGPQFTVGHTLRASMPPNKMRANPGAGYWCAGAWWFTCYNG